LRCLIKIESVGACALKQSPKEFWSWGMRLSAYGVPDERRANDMFEQLLESSEFAIPSKRPLTFGLAMVLHLTALGILMLVRPLFPETLPSQLRTLPVLLPPLPPAPPSQRARNACAKTPFKSSRIHKGLPLRRRFPLEQPELLIHHPFNWTTWKEPPGE